MKIGVYEYLYPIEEDEVLFDNRLLKLISRAWSDGVLKITMSKSWRDDRNVLSIETRKGEKLIYEIIMDYKYTREQDMGILYDVYVEIWLMQMGVSCKPRIVYDKDLYFIRLSSVEKMITEKGFKETILDIYQNVVEKVVDKCREFGFYPMRGLPEKYRDPESPEHAPFFKNTLLNHRITIRIALG